MHAELILPILQKWEGRDRVDTIEMRDIYIKLDGGEKGITQTAEVSNMLISLNGSF